MLLFAAALTACINEMEIKNRNVGSYLVLNAMLDAEDRLHSVHLSYYDGSDIDLPEGAEVTMCVNGVPQDAAGYDNGKVSNIYHFVADLAPGDIVRIDAAYNGEQVYAEVEVPQRASIVSADTLRSAKPSLEEIYFGSDRQVEFSLRLKDVPGEKNYYRLTMDSDFEMTAHFYEYPDKMIYSRPDSIYHETQRLNFDIGSDKILLDDYLPESSTYDPLEELFSSLNPHNTMRIFTDERFTDSVGDVRFTVDSLSFVPYYQGMEFWRNDPPEYVSRCYSSYEADALPSAHIRLRSLSFDAYNYFRAMNSRQIFGFEMSLFTEPTTVPSNVVGGLGFVSVASSAEAVIEFPSCHVLQPGGKPWFLEGE